MNFNLPLCPFNGPGRHHKRKNRFYQATSRAFALLARPIVAMFFGWVNTFAVPSAHAGTLEAINHTHWAINRFSVDGRSGLDIIGPYQGGGGGCCYVAPARWQPGMTVRVDWETREGSTKGYPGTEDWPKYLAWVEKINAQNANSPKQFPSPTTPAKKSAASPCTSCPVMTSRSPPPATPTAAPSTRSRPRCTCRSLSHAQNKIHSMVYFILVNASFTPIAISTAPIVRSNQCPIRANPARTRCWLNSMATKQNHNAVATARYTP